MAKATTVIRATEKNAAGVSEELLSALADHEDAVLKTLDLLEAARAAGILDFLQALIARSGEATAIAVRELTRPDAIAAMRGLMALLSAAGSINVSDVQGATSLLHGTLDAIKTPRTANPTGILALLREVKDPEVAAGLGAALNVLRALGAQNAEA